MQSATQCALDQGPMGKLARVASSRASRCADRGAAGLLTPMLYFYLLTASALTAVSLGALLYTVTGHGEWTVEGSQAPPRSDSQPEQLTARYREQMKRMQETLRDLGHAPGPIDGIMGAGTAEALRAFQQREGLRATGRANPETLAALRIKDRLRRAP